MKFEKDTSGIQRYVALDIHKEYALVGGQNARQEWSMPPCAITTLSNVYKARAGALRRKEIDPVAPAFLGLIHRYIRPLEHVFLAGFVVDE